MPEHAYREPANRNEIGELWRRVNREIHDRFKEAFRDSDFHVGVLVMLRHIQMMPGVTVSELSRRSGMVKSHVSSMIEQLVRRGYVEKRPDPDDQRLVRVYVTKAAMDKLGELEARAQRAWAGVLDEVPEDELKHVMRGLEVLLAALDKSNRQSSPREP